MENVPKGIKNTKIAVFQVCVERAATAACHTRQLKWP